MRLSFIRIKLKLQCVVTAIDYQDILARFTFYVCNKTRNKHLYFFYILPITEKIIVSNGQQIVLTNINIDLCISLCT